MVSFTSTRERRLWLWTLVVLATIYLSLAPGPAVAAALRARGMLEVSFYAALGLGLGFAAWRWLRRRPGILEIAVALGFLAVYLMTLLRFATPEERTHLFEYGVVAALLYQALGERRRNGRRVPAPAILTVVVTALLGWLDEGIQSLLPNRVYDLVDVGFNTLAVLMAVAASVALAAARRWVDARRRPAG